MTFGENDQVVEPTFGNDDPVEAPLTPQIGAAVKVDPDTAARAQRVARETGLPVGVVERNLDYVEQRQRVAQVEQQTMQSPAVANLFADPQAAKVAHDDVENLSFLDRALGAARRGWESFRQGYAGVAVGSNARTRANLDDVERRMAAGEQIADSEDWLGARFMSPEQRAQLRAELDTSIATGATNIAEREATKRGTVQPLPEVQAAQAAKDFGTFWENFKRAPLEFTANAALESLPSSAPGYAALAIPGAGLAVRAGAMGASSYAADYAGSILSALADEGVDLRDRDAIIAATRNPELMARVGRKAAAHATATAALDAASGGIAGKSITTGKLSNIVAQGVAQGAMGAAGEAAGTVAAGDELHAGSIAGEFLGELALSPVEVASASASVIVENRAARAAQAQTNGQALGEAMAAAGASKLNERDAALLARFANDAAQGESVFIDAQTFGQAAQAAGVDVQQLAQQIPTLAEQLQQAEATGADVEIPVGDAVAYLQPLASALVEHGRIGSPEAPTIAESYAQADTRQQVAQELAGAAVEEAGSVAQVALLATVQDAIEQQIVATGRFAEDVSTQYASLLSAMFNATASRLGVDVQAVYDEFAPRVVSTLGADVATFDQSRRGAYDPATRTIALFQSADLSTFLHEAGHFGLEMMVDLADRAPQIGADVDTIMQSFGVTREQWAQMDIEQRRVHHETFARSFEKYLFEGKAPSVELQSAFSRFRSWLLAVYRNLRALNVELSAEIREVFDRMLATEAQIAARSAPTLSLDGLVDPVEAATYQALAAQSQIDAVADFEAKSLRDLGRTRRAHGREMQRIRKQLAESRALIEAQVSLEVAQEPAFAARAALAAAPAEQKLSTKMLAEMYGGPDSVFGRFDWSSVQHLAAEKGQHPDIVAESFGFRSGDQLVRALVEAGDPAQHVEALVDKQMLEAHGELVDEAGIARAADAAIANDHRSRVLLMAANALRRAVGDKPILMREARQRAQMGLAGRKVREVKPGQYKVAEAKSQRLAAEAQARGRLAEAASHARNALLAHEYNREAIRIREEFEKGRAYLSKFNSQAALASLSPDYVEQIRNVLSSIDTRTATNKRLDSLASLRKWIARQEEAGLPVALDADLLDSLQVENIRDLTVEQFRGLVDQVKSIEHLGRLKQKLLTARDQRSFDERAEQAAESIRANAKRTRKVGLEPGRGLASWVGDVLADQRKLSSLFREMDGLKDGGAMFDLIVRPANDAATAEAVMTEDATRRLSAIFRPILALPGGTAGNKLHIAEIGDSLSRGARMAVALNLGNAVNRQRLMDGRGWGAAQVQAIVGTLTATELQAVNELHEFVDSYWPQVVETAVALTGVAPEKVHAEPFTVRSADGVEVTMRGGYWPLKYDADASGAIDAHEAAQAAKDALSGAYLRATTRRGHEMARLDEVKRPVRLSLDVATQHVAQVVHRVAWQAWLTDANRLLKDQRIDSAIREHYGPAVARTIRDGMLSIAAGDLPARSKFDQALRKLQSNVSRAVMGFSFTTAAVQLTGITQSMSRVGVGPMTRAIVSNLGDASTLNNSMAQIAERSDFMRLRAQTFNRELHQIQGRVIAGKSQAMQVVDAALFYMIQRMQLLVDVPTWTAAYQKALDAGSAEVDAVALADAAVRESQGSGFISDTSKVQRDHPLLMQFASFFNSTYNLIAERTNRTEWTNPASVGIWLGHMTLLSVLPATVGGLVLDLLKGDEPEDDEDWAKRLAQWNLGFVMGLFLGVREFAGSVAGFSYAGPPVGRVVTHAERLATQIGQGEVDEPAIVAAANLLGDVFGLPVTQIIRSFRGARAWLAGDAPGTSVLFGQPPKD
jgi:hypothetical protein